MVEFVFAALLCQQVDVNRPMNDFLVKEESIAQAAAQQKRHMVAIEQEDFTRRFNALVLALRAFQIEYSKAEGMVWPKKQADAVDKAIHGLQGSKSWKEFNPAKPDRDLAEK